MRQPFLPQPLIGNAVTAARLSARITRGKAVKALSRLDWVFLTLIGVATFVRFATVDRLTFSYDFFAYRLWFEEIGEMSWDEIRQASTAFFPYVGMKGFSFIEVGFVVIAKLVLEVFDPPGAFAFCAAASLAVRCAIMRSFGLGWGMVLLVQIFALTLLEANAIRAGMALTLCMGGLRLWMVRRQLLALFLLALACLVHLQALAYACPFILFAASSRFLSSRSGHRWAIAVALGAGLAALVVLTQMTSFDKLQDYQGQQTAAAGVSSLSVLTAIFATMAASGFLSVRKRLGAPDRTEYLWFSVFLACLPSFVLLLFATESGGVGVRVWQFAVVIMATVPIGKWLRAGRRLWMHLTLVALFFAADVNVLVRYPLSNFFAPLVEEQVFTPSSGAY